MLPSPSRRSLAIALLTSITLALPGCIIIAKNGHSEYPADLVTDTNSANWASIRAARGIRASAERSAALTTISQRSDLSQSDQIALVDAAAQSDMFSVATKDVLIAIVRNPTTTIQTRNYLSANLRRANLASSDRKLVTDALIETTPATPTTAPKP